MKRILAGTLLGTVILFIWGAVYWTVISGAFDGIKSLPLAHETTLVEALKKDIPSTGVYFIPGMPEHTANATAEEKKQVSEEWSSRHANGPLAMIVYNKKGVNPMSPEIFIRGFIVNLVSCLIACTLLSSAGSWNKRYTRRVTFIFLLGVFAAVITHVVQWNWFFMPLDYTVSLFADTVIGWLLTSLVIGAVVKPAR